MNPGFLLMENRWMGTYPELPSYVLETGEDLQDVMDKYPDELIGKTVAEKFNHTKLPYLPKVLSIAKALPLQLHPVGYSHNQFMSDANDIAEQRPCIKATPEEP
jgi:mannose-6-phosphate isomerase class I